MVIKEINIDKINNLIDQGYIRRNKHPEADLWILNYTPYTQYDKVWTEETIACRGLILDGEHKIVARPIPKFFNLEEIGLESLPKCSYHVFEKMDGSLGILYWLNEKPYISTRGSFDSEQATFANQLLQTKYADCIEKLDPSKTYVFEIIYPENRIVIDYKELETLTLLAIIDTASGKEEEIYEIGFPLPKNYGALSDISKLQKLNWENHEGFVIRFSNGYRVKVKFEEYLEIHKIVTQLSSIMIWENMTLDKSLIPFLEKVPDEFYSWVKKIENELIENYTAIENLALKELKTFTNEKETADYFKTCTYPSIMFSMWRKGDYKKIIWKMVKPTFELAYSK